MKSDQILLEYLEHRLSILQADEGDGHWVTLDNGNHIFIPEGENAKDVIDKHFNQLNTTKIKKYFILFSLVR